MNKITKFAFNYRIMKAYCYFAAGMGRRPLGVINSGSNWLFAEKDILYNIDNTDGANRYFPFYLQIYAVS